MLGKLLKYDYKANIFYFLLMYAVLMGAAVVARLSIAAADIQYFSFSDDHVLSVMAMVGSVLFYSLICGAVAVLTLLLIAMRFYKNLMGNEGYLTFTLPVPKSSHLISKMISGVSLVLLTYLALVLSAMVLTVGMDFWDSPVAVFSWRLLEAVRFDHPLIASLYCLEGLVTVIQVVAVVYFSICVGQLAGRHRVLGAIGIYLAVNVVIGIIAALGSTIFMRLLHGYEGGVFYYGITSTVTILFHGIVAAGCLMGSFLLMKWKLNLE